MYKFGIIVLVAFPFTDLTSSKLRPALIISKTDQKSEDVILAFLTSQKPKQNRRYFSIKSSEPYFHTTGLKTDSWVRFDKIATLSKKLILGELGQLPQDILKKMKNSFYAVFGF